MPVKLFHFLFFSHISILFLITDTVIPISGQCLEDEKSSLLSLISSKSRPQSWLPNTDCCHWKGVACDVATGHVIHLHLFNRSILDPIDASSSLFQLSHLRILDLSSNNFSFPIPSGLDRLLNLTHLNLSNSGFTGRIPREISHLKKLALLDLHSNRLQGSIPLPPSSAVVLDYSHNSLTSVLPSNFGSELNFTIFFSISGNKVSGKIPKSICNMRNLRVLDLSNNKLSDPIPGCLGKISKTLSVLNLRKNSLSGTIPEIFEVGCSLRTLNLNGNQFHGKLPRSLRYCRELEVLDLGNNRINDLIPSHLDSLSKLQVLVLRANEFHGNIIQFANFIMPMLQVIDLSSNILSGKLPEVWFKTLPAMTSGKDNQFAGYGFLLQSDMYQDNVLVTSKGLNMELVKIKVILASVDLSNNNFEGAIPEVLGSLNSIRILNVSRNSFTGSIPASIGNMTMLKSLDLSQNELLGAIPKVLGSLNSLHILNMSRNSFTGSIPASIGNMTMLESLDLSQNELFGEIPFELTNLTFLLELNLSYNGLHGIIPPSGQFLTFSNESFIGNQGLCGLPLSRKCPVADVLMLPSHKNINWFFISMEVGYFVGVGAIFFPLLFWRKWRRRYFRQMDKMLEKFPWWCQVF